MARPFPSFPKPLFQSKAKYKASDRKVSFYSDEDETYYHKKDSQQNRAPERLNFSSLEMFCIVHC